MKAQRARVRELLRERDLRELLGGQFLAQAADGFANATFANVLVLEPLSADTPQQILSLFALTLLPYSVIAPFLGVFVDRWPRRTLMVATNVIRGAVLGSLPFWHQALPGDTALYATILLLLSFGRLFLTTKSALLPVLLHEHHLLPGNAISSGGGMIAALIGGAIGLFESGAFGQTTAFIAAGLIYLIAAWVLALLSRPFSHAHRHARNVGAAIADIALDLWDGIRTIWTTVRARLALIGIFVVRTIGMFVFIAGVLVIKDAYPERSQEFGRLSISALALGAAGAGAFIGAISAPLVGRRLAKGGLILLGFVVSGLGIVALGGVQHVVALLALMLVGGYGGFITKVAVDAQIQEALPDELRGRAFALYDILFNLASVVAAAAMVATQAFSLRLALFVTGIATLAAAAVLGRVMTSAGIRLLSSSEASEQPA